MLIGIPKIISPELLKVLDEMGHGDQIVLADGNFPAESVGKNCKVIRMDGHGISEILDAVLGLFPLDHMVNCPVNLMAVSEGDDVKTPIWDTYTQIISKYHCAASEHIGRIERFEFYERAAQSYAIIATSESALYANIMLQKGIVKEE